MAERPAPARLTRDAVVAEAVFEIALGVFLATSPLTGFATWMGLPPPAYPLVIVV